jgi:hypothetical protein
MSYLRIATAPFALALLLAEMDVTLANEKSISLTPIGTYASGIFNAGVQRSSLMTSEPSGCLS